MPAMEALPPTISAAASKARQVIIVGLFSLSNPNM